MLSYLISLLQEHWAFMRPYHLALYSSHHCANNLLSGSGPQTYSQIQRSAAVHTSFNKDWWVQWRLFLLPSVIKIRYWAEGPKIDEQRCCLRSSKKGEQVHISCFCHKVAIEPCIFLVDFRLDYLTHTFCVTLYCSQSTSPYVVPSSNLLLHRQKRLGAPVFAWELHGEKPSAGKQISTRFLNMWRK